MTVAKPARVRINEMIRAKEIRVVDEEAGQLGIMTPEEALAIAKSRELDLVEVAPGASPPVCRIMNYGKFQYQKSKRAHEAKKNQRQVVIKEVKFRPKTEEHDFQFKKNHIVRFLEEGNKAKAAIIFRGREMAHQELGRRLMDRLVEELGDLADVERPPKMEGYALVAIFIPKKGG
ncbi:MAG: translation initiation factor IF-3 [Acidobacteria bacterium]|nr:translation initiation factor IF-3 [Acidobacteriota bacterium]